MKMLRDFINIISKDHLDKAEGVLAKFIKPGEELTTKILRRGKRLLSGKVDKRNWTDS